MIDMLFLSSTIFPRSDQLVIYIVYLKKKSRESIPFLTTVAGLNTHIFSYQYVLG